MTSESTLASTRIPAGARERASTRYAFLVAGLGCAVWAPLVPFAKERILLGDAALGLLLLCIGGGSVIAMPLAGLLTSRYGCRMAILASGFLLCACLPALVLASSIPTLAIALLVFGAAMGTIDVSMNIQAVIVERAAGRPIMSGFHALFSAGGILGAAGMSAFLSLGLSPLSATIGMAVCMACLLIAAAKSLLPYGEEGGAPSLTWPRGPVFLLGGLCFICFMAEGSILDWSALFLTNLRDMPPEQAGLGYAAFSATMTAGRFAGDRIVATLGGRRVLTLGGICAASGFLLAVLTSSTAAAIIGFALVGIGASNVVPVLFSTAGRQKGLSASIAIPAVTTLGYVGLLSGPALIGFVSSGFGLGIALSLLAALLLVMAASVRFIDIT